MKLRDELIVEEWSPDEIPEYFPRLREDGAALFATLPAEVVERACLLLMRDRYRDVMRHFPAMGDEEWYRKQLRRKRGPPSKPVLAAFREAGLSLARAREANAILSRCFMAEERAAANLTMRATEQWWRLIDRMIAARRGLRADGIKRPSAEQVKAAFEHIAYRMLEQIQDWRTPPAKEKDWRTPPVNDGDWLAALAQRDWDEAEKLGLVPRSISWLEKHQRRPSME